MFSKTLPALAAACMIGLAGSAFAGETKKHDIVDTAVKAGTFKTLVAAVSAAELVDTLKSPGPFTVFAPTDEAFAALPEGTVETLLKPENKDTLIAVLTYHVVPGKVAAADAIKLDGKSAKTVEGSEIDIAVADGKVKINDATVVAADVEASNGIIHVIDKVLLPPTPQAKADDHDDRPRKHRDGWSYKRG